MLQSSGIRLTPSLLEASLKELQCLRLAYIEAQYPSLPTPHLPAWSVGLLPMGVLSRALALTMV